MGKSDASLTPEQQLLKLIENEGEAGKQGAGKGKGPAPREKGLDFKKYLSVNYLRERLSYFSQEAMSYSKRQKETFTLKKLVTLLKLTTWVVGAFLLLGLAFDFAQVNQDLDSYFGVEQQERADLSAAQLRTFDSGFYERMNSENVFVPTDKRAELAIEPTSAEKVNMQLVEMTKNLKLTGISRNPQDPKRSFVMIEDLTKSTTHFLKTGDVVAGLRVSQINEDGVVLSYQDDEIELR